MRVSAVLQHGSRLSSFRVHQGALGTVPDPQDRPSERRLVVFTYGSTVEKPLSDRVMGTLLRGSSSTIGDMSQIRGRNPMPTHLRCDHPVAIERIERRPAATAIPAAYPQVTHARATSWHRSTGQLERRRADGA